MSPHEPGDVVVDVVERVVDTDWHCRSWTMQRLDGHDGRSMPLHGFSPQLTPVH